MPELNELKRKRWDKNNIHHHIYNSNNNDNNTNHHSPDSNNNIDHNNRHLRRKPLRQSVLILHRRIISARKTVSRLPSAYSMRHSFLFILFLLLVLQLLPNQGAEAARSPPFRQLAYGVHSDYQDIAHTRLLQMNERTALDCTGAGKSNITWYRRTLHDTDAGLGSEEKIEHDTLLVDWKWTETTEKDEYKEKQPQQLKFELTTSFSGADSRLIIHQGEWHDLGQYYCVSGGETGDVKAIYLLYQRPQILFAQMESNIKFGLKDPSSIGGPLQFVDSLRKLRESAAEERLILKKKGAILALWRAYPFVDRKSTAPKGFQHSGYNWDDGDVCRWMKKKNFDMEKRKEAFTGELGKDVELLKADSRYSFEIDTIAGMATWTIDPVNWHDEGNQTLSVRTSRGASFAFLDVRVEDPIAFLWPLIGVIVEIVIVVILTAAIAVVERRRSRKVKEERQRSVGGSAANSKSSSKDRVQDDSGFTANTNAIPAAAESAGAKPNNQPSKRTDSGSQ